MAEEEYTAEFLAQRILDVGVLDTRQLEIVWSSLGTRNVSFEDFKSQLFRKELITNFQLDKMLKGDREGFIFGNYITKFFIGAGTFARVYRAAHREHKRVAAVKVLRRRFRSEPAQVEQFLREASMGKKLKHINIVRVHEVSGDIRAPYMVMDYVEGETLRQFMARRKKLDLATALSLITDVVNGLDYAISQGITHRDMKLSNVLVTSKGRAKLVDFGLATISSEKDSDIAANPNARSIDYVALERGTGVRKGDPRSDLYFTGCMLYHLITGQSPLLETRDRLQRMNVGRFEDVVPITNLAPDLPRPLVTLINRAMAFQPSNRYQSASEMLNDLKNVGKRSDIKEEAAVGAGGEVMEGKSFTVMLVDSHAEMQSLVREQLKKRGYQVLITGNPERAMQRMREDEELVDCVIFSTKELGAEAVRAFNKMKDFESTERLPAVLMVGKKQTPLQEAAAEGKAPHRVILPMPFTVKELRLTLHQLLNKAND